MTLNRPDLSPDHPANKLPDDMLRMGQNQFAAKLSFNERCQILALRLSNMSIGSIAVTFSINRRTVTHICNPESPRYHNVRAMLEKMGEKDFIHKYVDEDLLIRVRNAAQTEEAKSTYVVHEDRVATAQAAPNQRATANAGISVHKGPTHEHSHRIQIEWVEMSGDVPSGWYAKLLDVTGIDAENWLGDPDARTHVTSKSALAYARNYLDENY